MRLPSIFEDDIVQFATGVISSFFFDHFARYTLNPMPAYIIVDKEGKYVWGYGVNNAMTLGAGAVFYGVGKYKDMKKLKTFGKGWLFYTVLDKFIIQPMQYNYVLNPPPPIKALSQSEPARLSNMTTPVQPRSTSSVSYQPTVSKYRLTA